MTETSLLDRRLGWSLGLTAIDPIDGAAGGLDLDFSTVSGEAALMQSLTLAFVTLQGSDPFNQTFGFSGLAAIAEENDAILRRERIRMAVIATLKAEPRIARIVTVRYSDETGEAPRAPSPTPPGRNMAIEAVFETVAGVQHAITLGGEVLDVR